MAPQGGALGALAEGLSLPFSIHICWLISAYNSNPNTLCIYTHMHKCYKEISYTEFSNKTLKAKSVNV